MKILLVHNYYREVGGEDIYFESQQNLLKKANVKVFTYTKKSADILSVNDKLQAGTAMFWNKKNDEELRTVIQKVKPDVAHFHNIFPFITPSAYKICHYEGVKVVQRIPTYRFLCPKGTLFKEGSICELCVKKRFKYPATLYKCYRDSHLESLAFSSSLFFHSLFSSLSYIDRYMFQAKFVRDYHMKYLPIKKAQTTIIPHFVPDHKYASIHKDNYFIFAGRLSEEKGILELVDVFQKLPDLQLYIVGDGPLRKTVEKNAVLSKNITIFGYQPRNKVLELMSKALCTIIPSPWYETGPFVLMESFSVATPVIVPKLGVFVEQIKDGENGLFYEPKNLSELAKKIQMMAKKNNHKAMCKYAHTTYKQKYTSEIHIKNLLELYTGLKRSS